MRRDSGRKAREQGIVQSNPSVHAITAVTDKRGFDFLDAWTRGRVDAWAPPMETSP